MRFYIFSAGLDVVYGMCLTFIPLRTIPIETPVSAVTKPLQFLGRHTLGFTARQVVVAMDSHALRVEFAGAREVAPVAEKGGASQ